MASDRKIEIIIEYPNTIARELITIFFLFILSTIGLLIGTYLLLEPWLHDFMFNINKSHGTHMFGLPPVDADIFQISNMAALQVCSV